MRLLSVLIVAAAIFACSHCDDSPGPGFFLKITKNIPRIGRRSESFFTKNSRTIPRIGRGADAAADLSKLSPATLNVMNWFKAELETPKAATKRMMMSNAAIEAATERELSVVQPVNSNTLIELLNKDAIPNENVKFVHWKDFDRALQLDMDLYAKVISIGRRPDQRLKEDLGFSTYVPVSFFSATNRNAENVGAAGFYNNRNNNNNNNMGNEIWSGKYERDMLEYNELK